MERCSTPPILREMQVKAQRGPTPVRTAAAQTPGTQRRMRAGGARWTGTLAHCWGDVGWRGHGGPPKVKTGRTTWSRDPAAGYAPGRRERGLQEGLAPRCSQRIRHSSQQVGHPECPPAGEWRAERGLDGRRWGAARRRLVFTLSDWLASLSTGAPGGGGWGLSV